MLNWLEPEVQKMLHFKAESVQTGGSRTTYLGLGQAQGGEGVQEWGGRTSGGGMSDVGGRGRGPGDRVWALICQVLGPAGSSTLVDVSDWLRGWH